MRTSPTPRSSSVCDTRHLHAVVVDDPRNRDDLVASHDERPTFAVRARDLCVDEHVLDLPAATGEAVSGSPASYLKPWELGTDTPRPPRDLALELDRRALQP